MHKIAKDTDFIDQTLGPIAQVDKFTGNLLEVNRMVQREGIAQPVISCINRADYMLDKYHNGSLRIRQVEVNAIASSMSAHSSTLSALHGYLFSKYDISLPNDISASIPENNSLTLVAQGIIEAFDAYNKNSAYILLVNEERSLNFSDQHIIELRVHTIRPDVKFVRRRFIDLPQLVRLGPNKELLLEDSKEIALVYFRYGYDPSNYNFDGSWKLRLLIERSRAIKCPSINFHLSGAKKFQQVLHSEKALERFLVQSDASRLVEVFCKFWSLNSEDSEINIARQLIDSDANKLVLKPQREGGGHNIFGCDIKHVVDSITDPAEQLQYILMEFINSPREHNWILLQDDANDKSRLDSADSLVSELGIFGSILADGSGVVSNKTAGYLVRSKKSGINEGGVATGYAGISNILLIDDNKLKHHYNMFYDD